jgi:hypothetical protein
VFLHGCWFAVRWGKCRRERTECNDCRERNVAEWSGVSRSLRSDTERSVAQCSKRREWNVESEWLLLLCF